MLKPKLLLRLAAVTTLLGMGWLAFTSGLSLRELVWDVAAFSGVTEFFGWSWTDWVTNAAVDRGITLAEKIAGGFFLLFALILALIKPVSKGLLLLAAPLTALLLLRVFLFWKEHFYQIGALWELCIQTFTPLLFLWFLAGAHRFAVGKAKAPSNGIFWLAVRGTIALTFIGHGLYAAGYHPVPAHFVFMTQSGLGVGEDMARKLLLGVGVLDFLAAGLLLLPWRKAWFAALAWIIPWAMLTTMARVWSYGGFVGLDTLLAQWLPQMVVRLPHVLLPLALLFWARTQDAKTVERPTEP